MKKFLMVFGLNFMYWAVYFVVIFVFLILLKDATDPKYITEAREKDLIRSVVLMFLWPAVLNYLTNYFYVIRFLKSKRVLKLFVFFSISLIANTTLSTFILYFTSPLRNQFSFDVFGNAFLLSIIGLFHGIMGLIIKGFVLWFEDMNIKKMLLEKNHEMELALVKSQLDPHFLFNSINNIDVLIHKDAEKASLFLNKLSDIMRFMLFETKHEKIELSKELAYIGKYVDLQKIRSSNPDYVKLDFQVEDDGVLVAPMIFIPFIENAFKYSETFKSEEAVQIELKVTTKSLEFICNNKYSLNQMKSIGGLGNDLIQKRLDLLYPSHQLTILDENGIFQVKLKIDL